MIENISNRDGLLTVVTVLRPCVELKGLCVCAVEAYALNNRANTICSATSQRENQTCTEGEQRKQPG